MDHPFRAGVRSVSRLAIDDGALLSGRYWGEMRTFLAVAKAKSLAKGATKLGISRMTAGREIKRLQDVIGSQLITLCKTGATLTPRGEELAQTLLRFDQELFSIANDLRGETRKAEGVARLSITEGLAVLFLAPALRELATKYPGVRVELKNPQNYMSLRENQTDMMVGFSPEKHPDMTSTRAGTLHYVPMVSRTYAERFGRPALDNLRSHSFVDADRYSPKIELWRPWHKLVEQGATSYSCESSTVYGMMVKAGLGIGLMSSINVLEPSAIPLELDCQIDLPLYVTALTERLRARPVRILFDFVLSVLGEENPWLAPEVDLDPRKSSYTQGYEMLFNLRA
jgi:DNA-binding transcriptional LysR family regulator